MSSQSMVEVWALYGETVLDVRHLRGDRASGSRYTIGEAHHASLVVAPPGLPQRPRFALVQDATLCFTASMTGEVVTDTQTLTLRELVDRGCASVHGATFRYPIPQGVRCRVEHHAVTFLVRAVPRGDPVVLPFQSNRRFWVFTALSFVLLGAFLASAYVVGPAGDELAVDHRIDDASTIALATFADRRPTLRGPDASGTGLGDPTEAVDQVGGRRGSEGEGGGDGRGSGGERRGDADPRGGGDEDSARPEQTGAPRVVGCSRPDLLAVEANRWTLPSQVRRVPPCEPPVRGGIPQMAMNFDPDMFVARRPGTTYADRTHAPASLDAATFELGHGPRPAPKVRPAKPTVKGNLDPDIIRLMVRAHLEDVRRCYARGVERDPELRGRTAIVFRIGTRGTVRTARVGRSTLGDRRVERCTAKAVRRWTFPPPRDGAQVVVTAPFILTPA